MPGRGEARSCRHGAESDTSGDEDQDQGGNDRSESDTYTGVGMCRGKKGLALVLG